MKRAVVWEPVDDPGIEHLELNLLDDGAAEADGMVVLLETSGPLRLHYRIRCDRRWRVREALIELADKRLELRSDGEGNWQDGGGTALEALQGCIDVDIMVTPFTNTLPIRRLGLASGQSAELKVAYIPVPALRVTKVLQRYTRLGPSTYRYEGLDTGFTAELPIDADGLVEDYPPIWRRLWPR